MAGIYIHIPFCKQACYYCNFHFSTLLIYKESVVKAIAKELFLRKDELNGQKIETVYWGGGTPSLLSAKEMDLLIAAIYDNYDLSELKEFTIEANPDDLNNDFLNYLKHAPINRLSMGIQSFEESHLKLMNRAHTAEEAIKCVKKAQDIGIEKISIDLIYGIPGMDLTTWGNNLQKAILLGITHISSYCLTIEPKTVFGLRTEKKQLLMPEEGETSVQFEALIHQTEAAGFGHYEVSNFAKNKEYAIHNTNYWNGLPYLGIGPAAHSYFPGMRMWNIANNQHYIKALDQNVLPLEKEILTTHNQFNEYLMTGLRTQWGIDLQVIEAKFGLAFVDSVMSNLSPYIKNEQAIQKNHIITLSKKGRFFADGIAAAAFIID